jgi:glycosyltransferase involved in cell wall biosynthesis
MSGLLSARAPGALDLCPVDGVTGWAAPGSSVRVTVDGVPVGEAVAGRRRLAALDRPAESACGFRLAEVAALFDGRPHTLAAYDVPSGLELEGSPLDFRSGAAQGRVEALAGNVIAGSAFDPSAPERPVIVAALAGDEVVALAVARPVETDSPGPHPFRLLLSEDLLRTGAGFVHVAVVGSDVRLQGSPVLLPYLPPVPVEPRLAAPRPVTLAIKIAAPNLKVAHEWGDFHFANALAAALHKRGWIVRVDCADAWAREGDDAVLVLRGRHRFRPKPESVNLLWVISHPDRMAPGEVDSFDHVFVAAEPYARILARISRRPVEVLHQATDPGVFRGDDPITPPAPLLFVGNSRREYRRMVRWCVEEQLDVAVYGTLWREVIPDRLIRGEHIPNDELHRWYAGAAVVLNDHWDTMLTGGFLSNRLFDASAAGAFIITDPVSGLAEVFGDSIETADSAAELAAKVRLYAAEPERARAKAEAARRLVLASHTFDHRADVIAKVVMARLQAKGVL